MIAVVSRVDLADRGTVRRAARLERELMRDEPRFHAELDADVERRFSGRSALIAQSEQAVFVVTVDNMPVGRCSAIISRRWQEHHNEPASGFIGDLAVAADAQQVGVELVREAERWLASRAITRVYGGTSHWAVRYAVSTSRFDADAVFPMRWDPPQVASVLEQAGYRRGLPVWTYAIDLVGGAWRTAASAARANQQCLIRPIVKRRWDEELATITAVVNDTFADEWEFQPATVAGWHELYDAAKLLTDPRHTQIAEVDGRAAGVCLGIRDLASAMRELDGRMGPVRVTRFLRERRRASRGSLFVVGVCSEYRGRGIGSGLVAAVLERFAAQGMTSAAYHLVNDENRASRALANHRFEKQLA